MQRRITLALRRGITAHFINASGQQAYAVVERPLTDLLRRDGVTVEEITEPRHLPDYDSVNFGVWIDLHQLARDMGCDDTRTSPFNITEGVHDAVSR
ncbi:MAG: hypothetical protein GY926_05565 [bacterium]|nr:hypothetical protein [bacterium]